ncbi:MAG: diguanylate cyclase [Pseudomarimonas sp.]
MTIKVERGGVTWTICALLSLWLTPLHADDSSPMYAAEVARIQAQPTAARAGLFMEQARHEQSRNLSLSESWARLALAAAQAQADHAAELDARIMLANLALLATRPDDAEPELDALAQLLAQSDLRQREAEVLVLRGRWQLVTRRYDEAKASLAQAQALASTLGDRASEAKALHNQGLLAIRTGLQEQARPLLEASLVLNDADGREREADANRHYLGFVARDQGRYAEALDLHRVVIEHGRARGDTQVIAHSANALGILHAQQLQTAEALAYFQEAADAYGLLGDRFSEAMAHINIGNSFVGAEQWEKGLVALERGLTIATAEKNADAEILARAERAKVLLKLQRPEEAQTDAVRAMQLAETGATSMRLHQAAQALGLVLAQTGKQTDAEQMFLRSVQASQDSGRKSEHADALRELARTQAALGKHADANRNLEAYIDLISTLRDDEMTRKLAELRVQLETRQRETELEARQQRINLLEQQAEQESRIRLLMVAALLSSVLFMLALVSRYRTRQQAESQLRAQNAVIAKANLDLAEAADTDALTQTRNRRYFQRVVLPNLQAAQRDGREHALILIDADRFKRINDDHGHDVGDTALVSIVDAWACQLEPVDVLLRWGGEEFLMVLFDRQPPAVLECVTAGLAATRAKSITTTTGSELRVSVSAGWACGPWPNADSTQLLALADRALLHAKSQGRDRGYGLHAGMDGGGDKSRLHLLDLTTLQMDEAR